MCMPFHHLPHVSNSLLGWQLFPNAPLSNRFFRTHVHASLFASTHTRTMHPPLTPTHSPTPHSPTHSLTHMHTSVHRDQDGGTCFLTARVNRSGTQLQHFRSLCALLSWTASSSATRYRSIPIRLSCCLFFFPPTSFMSNEVLTTRTVPIAQFITQSFAAICPCNH
jgi:hypothetical protein